MASIEELIELSLDQGVELQACQMTIELMDYDESEFYDEVTVGVGARPPRSSTWPSRTSQLPHLITADKPATPPTPVCPCYTH